MFEYFVIFVLNYINTRGRIVILNISAFLGTDLFVMGLALVLNSCFGFVCGLFVSTLSSLPVLLFFIASGIDSTGPTWVSSMWVTSFFWLKNFLGHKFPILSALTNNPITHVRC